MCKNSVYRPQGRDLMKIRFAKFYSKCIERTVGVVAFKIYNRNTVTNKRLHTNAFGINAEKRLAGQGWITFCNASSNKLKAIQYLASLKP